MPTSRRAMFVLAAGSGVFLLVLGYLVASSLTPRTVPEFEITPRLPRAVLPDSLVVDLVTVDASSERQWRFFDFATGAPMDPPDTAGWDIAFRRFRVMVADGARDLGQIPFDSVSEVPSDSFTVTAFGRDTTNAAISRWYRYSLFSHMLEPDGRVFAVRTADGRYAKLQFLGYYCPGIVPGCVTFRYAYQGDGSRQLD